MDSAQGGGCTVQDSTGQDEAATAVALLWL